MPLFRRYLGIHYSGTQTMDAPLPALRVYSATPASEPVEVRPPNPKQAHWSRQTLAHWLATELLDHPATIVGIDHALAFPQKYRHAPDLHGGWEEFVEDFKTYWPTHEPKVTVEYIRKGVCGRGDERQGDAQWRRLCEGDVRKQFHSKAMLGSVPLSATLPASLFDFDAPGSVAEATHAGLPWAGYLREQLGEELHLWPIDGWVPDEDQSVLAEAYPTLLKAAYPSDERDPHQQSAYTTTRWLRETDAEDELLPHFHPRLRQFEKDAAHWEGWILGVHPAPEGDPAKLPKEAAAKQSGGARAEKHVGAAGSSPAKAAKGAAKGNSAAAKESKAAAKGTSATKGKKSPGKAGKKESATAQQPAKKASKNSRTRERIHEFVDKLHGKIVTPRQLFFLEAALGSLDDTLNEKEVLSILEAMPADFSMPPRHQMRLIHIDGDFNITTFPAPPPPHDPDEYYRRHPRR